MMSLVKMSLFDITKRQFLFKIKAFQSVFTTLIIIQLISYIFSFNGVAQSHGGFLNIDISISYFSSEMILIFTMMWAFIISITITREENRLMDVSFVSNHLSSHLSNLAFIIFMCIVGSVFAILSGFFYKTIAILYFGSERIIVVDHYSFLDIMLGISSTTIYLLLLSSVGYLVGMLLQWQPVLKFVLPALLVGSIIFIERESGFIGKIVSYFALDKNLLSLSVKVLIVFAICSIISIGLSKRLEVRQ